MERKRCGTGWLRIFFAVYFPNKPSIIDLQKKVKCRYMLVSIVAKRARQLVGQDELLNNQKAVSYAVNELNNDELEITYPEEQ